MSSAREWKKDEENYERSKINKDFDRSCGILHRRLEKRADGDAKLYTPREEWQGQDDEAAP
jgi:hypothetical protein